MKTYRLLN